MLRLPSTHSRSLLFVAVLSLALAALSFRTERAFMMSAGTAPVAPMLAGIIVNTTVDEDNTGAACSLREAIVAANTNAAFGGCTAGAPFNEDIITFTVTGTITLTSALPNLTSGTLINGPGASQLTVSGNNSVFDVTGGGTPGSVTVSGLTISNGNTGMRIGAVINNYSNGTVKINNSIISGNSSADPNFGGGGGIYNGNGFVIVTDSTLSGNSSSSGGGIYNVNGTVNIYNSTLSGNSALNNGGGIFNYQDGTINVINSTISGNSANSGGGIYNNANGHINLTNSTITGNAAPQGGGGIHNFGSGPSRLRNSIVALNFSGVDPDVRGAMTSQGHNLIGTNGSSTGFTPGVNNPNGDLVGTNAAPLNPQLGSLADNGGLTRTHALLPGSPAIDAGDNCVLTNVCSGVFADPLTTDQRGAGFSRSRDGNNDGTQTVDIGAFESQQILVVTNTNDTGAGSLRQAITDANANAGLDTISFNIPTVGPGCSFGVCTISLATALPDLSTDIVISGPGANLVTVMRSEAPATPQFSIFTIPQNATVAISGLMLTNASSPQNGGAIRNTGTLTLSGLIISNNQTTGGAGASALFNGGTGTVTLANSSIWENIASGFAAVYNQGSTVSIINSTFAGNQNLSSSAPGSAIFSEVDSVTNVTSCTIAENIGVGAALFQNGGGSGQLNLKNCIVAGNPGGNTSGVTNLGNNLIGGSPRLGPLQLNGGPTQTMALLAGSPALDAGTDLTTLAGTFDSLVSTITVGDASSIPTGFAIQIDSEQMVVISKAGNTLTVTRGANGTTADAHVSGAGVNLAFDQRGAGFQRKADGPDANTTQTVDIGAFEAGASIEDVPDKSTNEDVPLTFTFNVGDAATPFNNIVATSSDPDLVPNSNIVIGPNSPSTRTLSITPATNQSGFAVIAVTVTKGSQNMFDLFFLTVNPVADTPSVTNATTNANTQTTSGLVISRNPADGGEVTHFKITGITGGTLFKNNGTSTINNGDFITFAEGNAGLKFTPGTTNGSFNVQASLSASDAGLGGATALVTITVNPLGGVLRFSTGNYSVAEDAGSKTITVERSGDTSQAIAVDYASSDHSNPADFIPCTSPGAGFASSRCDFTTAIGTLRFAAGETSKTFNVLISQDDYVEGPESLNLTLSNPTGGAVFGIPSTAMLGITDDATEPATNPVDTSSDFVRSQYHDFLNREPDPPGHAFWTDNIEKCNDPARRPAGQTVAQCIDKQRESTAVAFFMSPEFQITGGFVYHLYKGSLTGSPNYDGGSPGSSLGRFPTSLEFMRDVSQVSEGIVVNNQISGAVVEANRNRLAADFVQRPEFVAKYGALSNTLYVQELFNTTGIMATAGEKQALVDGLTNGPETRASVLRKVVDGTVVISEGNVPFTTTYGQAFYNQENRRVFVFMEYVGYLRRNPDTSGFNHWLGKLNFYNGDPFQAEMVRSFILAPEYRLRFGQP